MVDQRQLSIAKQAIVDARDKISRARGTIEEVNRSIRTSCDRLEAHIPGITTYVEGLDLTKLTPEEAEKLISAYCAPVLTQLEERIQTDFDAAQAALNAWRA